MPSEAPTNSTRLLLTSRPPMQESPLAVLLHDMNNKLGTIVGGFFAYEEIIERGQFEFMNSEINRVRWKISSLFSLAKRGEHPSAFQDALSGVRGRLIRILGLAKDLGTEEMKNDYREMIEAAKEFDELVEQGILLSRAQPPHENPVRGDIAQFVSDLVHSYQARYPQICFHFSIDNAQFTEFRPISIKRALENLLNNAIQSMSGEGGEISVDLKMRSYRAEETPFAQIEEGTYVNIEISDNGPGIPQDIMSRLSQAHCTTKLGGSGLGLISASDNIAKHKGHLFIESEVGHGTKVTALLPSLPPPAMNP